MRKAIYFLSAVLLLSACAEESSSPPVDLFEMAGITSSPYRDPQYLGFIDRYRLERCIDNAVDKPTSKGVEVALHWCQERFLRRK